MKVFISAGHQENTGANGHISEGKEAIILRDLIVSIMKQKAPEIDIITDLDGDGLQATIKRMRDTNPDISLDIHFNCATPTATGTEIFIADNKSGLLAERLVGCVAETLGIKNRGVKNESLSQYSKLGMLHGGDGVKMLLEVCFVSNKADTDKYIKNREKLAENLTDILIEKS